MVFNDNITTITATGTLDILEEVYLVDATAGNMTITLPDITADGMRYKLIRIDDVPANLITVQGFNVSQTISGAISISLFPNTVEELKSNEDVWYLSSNTVNRKGIAWPYNTIFTTQANKFISVNSGTATEVGTFMFGGTNAIGEPSYMRSVCLQNPGGGGASRTGEISITNEANTAQYAVGTFLSGAVATKTISTIVAGTDAWPTGESVLIVRIRRSVGGNGQTEIYSLQLS